MRAFCLLFALPAFYASVIRQPLAPPSLENRGLESVTAALTGGSVVGFCAGRAARAAGNTAAAVAGTGFVLLGLMEKQGYITINQKKVELDLLRLLDLNQDGKVDTTDYEFLSQKLASFLTEHAVGSAGGVAAGFALGFKTG